MNVYVHSGVLVHVCLRAAKTGCYPQWLPEDSLELQQSFASVFQPRRTVMSSCGYRWTTCEPCTRVALDTCYTGCFRCPHIVTSVRCQKAGAAWCIHLLTVAVMFLRQHASPSSAEQVERISIRKLNLLSRRLLSQELRLVHLRKEALNRFAFLSDYSWSNRDERKRRPNKPVWTLLWAG